ncbi:MAG: HDOD domain-containing protein [Candidatus Hydrogenedens sp.]|nr:HDOD domain-containing protein [Candidatus Hydrogenedens sp.]
MSKSDENRKNVMQQVETVPQLPAAVARVLQLAQDPHSSIPQIMEAMESDPGLTAEALRLANSAYFAGPRQIASLRDAGVLLGVSRITQLVVAAALFPIAAKPVAGYDLHTGALVDGLLGVAVGTEVLANTLGKIPPTHAFTAGLLHDIGKIAMGDIVARCQREIRDCAMVEGMTYEKAERFVLGIDRAEAGAALLRSWGLPDKVVGVVRWHMQPDNAPEEDVFVTDLVHIARIMATECGLGVGVDGLQYSPSAGSIRRLGLTEELEARAMRSLINAYKDIREQLAKS